MIHPAHPWLAPARVGMRAEDVDIPALIVEIDALERNLRRMAGAAARAGVRLRPHARMHKCPALALRQIALGAAGVCVDDVGNAGPLSIAAGTAGTSVDVSVEVDVGANRRGVEALWPVSARGAMW